MNTTQVKQNLITFESDPVFVILVALKFSVKTVTLFRVYFIGKFLLILQSCFDVHVAIKLKKSYET
jgi:hypothetical protein